VDMAI